MERFTCCQAEPHFETIKNGYQCMDCGKVFLNRSIDYNTENLVFDKLRYQVKFRGRKADYIKSINLFSTLQTGVVNIMQMDDEYTVLEQKNIKVKKSVLTHRLHFNHTLLTITDHGVIDVYDTTTEKAIAQFKSKKEYYKLEVFPLGKTGNWLYIDTEKIVCFSNDFQESRTIVLFQDMFREGVMWICSVDVNTDYDCFAIHVRYLKNIDDKTYIRGASFVIKYQDDDFDVKHTLHGAEDELTYDFERKIYRGINQDKMLLVKEDGKIDEVCELPTVRSYSDGGGVFWVDEFISSANKLYFIRDHVIALLYDGQVIVLDIQKQEILHSMEVGYNLIQSFFVMDAHTICFSGGLNTYIVSV